MTTRPFHRLLPLLLLLVPLARADELAAPGDLQAAAAAAACAGQPVIIMFGSATCPYCERVRPYLAALQLEPRHPGIVVYEVDTGGDERLDDFSGSPVTMRELAARHGVQLVPTVMAFGPAGEVLGEPLVGVTVEDFYAWYLEGLVDTARDRLSAAPSGAPAGYACD